MSTPRPAIRLLLLLFLICFARPAAADGDVLLVDAAGSGDFTTVGAAVDAAADEGDVIRVLPGVYAEAIDTDKSITIEGVEGAETTTLTGLDVQRILRVRGGAEVVLRDLTFTRGYNVDVGGALYVREASRVTVERCRFVDNRTAFDGGAVHVRNQRSVLRIVESVFEDNRSSHNGGAINVVLDAELHLVDSVFARNRSLIAGAVAANDARMSIVGSAFLSNDGAVSAVRYVNSLGLVENCTFYDNRGTNATVDLLEGDPVSFRRNVLVGEQLGVALQAGAAARSCNVYWNNAQGPADVELVEGEIVADPGTAGGLPTLTMHRAPLALAGCDEYLGAHGLFDPADESSDAALGRALVRH